MDNIRIISARDVTRTIFWILFLQGVLAALIGVLVLLYPEIVPALIAAMFFWLGLSTLALAWRIRRFWKEIPDIFA